MVRLNGRRYEVIGVFEKDPGLFGGFGVDQFAVYLMHDQPGDTLAAYGREIIPVLS